jgi:hypothetical protein
MNSTCPQSSGATDITITNISGSDISGTLQVVLKERYIDHPWSSYNDVEFCNRDMLPDANGESISLSSGESTTKSRIFTINSGWVKDNCRLVAFLQKSDKEIVEGCIIGVNEGTPVVTTKKVETKEIILRNTNESLMMYSPYTGDHEISIVDLRGRNLAQYTLKNTHTWIVIPASISSGAYIIAITVNNKRTIKRIIGVE